MRERANEDPDPEDDPNVNVPIGGYNLRTRKKKEVAMDEISFKDLNKGQLNLVEGRRPRVRICLQLRLY
jgi:hypothetical protein